MKRSRPSKAAIEQVRRDAQAKRAELGLEPVAPGNAEYAEYEAQQAARKARRKGKRR